MVGETIAHYRITAKLGARGMGEAYRATDTKLGRDVALKILPEALTAAGERLARFAREAPAKDHTAGTYPAPASPGLR